MRGVTRGGGAADKDRPGRPLRHDQSRNPARDAVHHAVPIPQPAQGAVRGDERGADAGEGDGVPGGGGVRLLRPVGTAAHAQDSEQGGGRFGAEQLTGHRRDGRRRRCHPPVADAQDAGSRAFAVVPERVCRRVQARDGP